MLPNQPFITHLTCYKIIRVHKRLYHKNQQEDDNMKKALLLIIAVIFILLGLLEKEYFLAETFVRIICISCLGLG